MKDYILANAKDLYALSFWGALICVAALEAWLPKRSLRLAIAKRWGGNVTVTLISSVAIRAVIPLSGLALAVIIQDHGWGLLNVVQMPAWLSFVIAFLLLDFARYGEHLLMHNVPLLWRLHRLHHTDQDVDFTTQLRAHPLEVVFGGLVGLCAIALVGPPIIALLIFDIVFAAQAFLTHSNLAIPPWLDGALRRVFTTPDVHRIHHSIDLHESNSNFGAMFTWWDRLFGTFVEQPALGHSNMVLGVAEYQDAKHQQLKWMLLDPFLDQKPATERLDESARSPS